MPPEPSIADIPALIRSFVDAGMDACVIVDREMRVVYSNAAYVHLTGWRAREFERSKMAGMCHEHFGLQSCEDGCVGKRSMESGKPTRVDEVQATRKALRLHIVAIPLMDADGVVWGAMEQYRDVTAESNMQEQYKRLLDAERAQRELLSQELAQTTASSKEALEKERVLSQTDGLTGLFNRRYFDKRLAERLVPALNGGSMLAMILFDLDKFKNVNDTYGHAGGDETLKEFARVLRGSGRDQDVVARFGGEEFAMLIAGNSIQGARVVAARVIERVHERVRAGALLTTTSGGIAICPADGTTASELIQAADRALYAAKRTGRDRILYVGDIPANTEELKPPPDHTVKHLEAPE